MSDPSTPSVPTLEVPAPLYDAALAFCNDRLREQGKEPIDVLPAGLAHDAAHCPCGAACGRWIGTRSWFTEQPLNEFESEPAGLLPYSVARFVNFFDEGCAALRVVRPRPLGGLEATAPVLPVRAAS